MVFADMYLQPDAADPVLDEQIIVEAARRHVPDSGRLLAVDESGGEARAYFLEGDLIVKTQRPHRLRPRTSLAKEAFFLHELHRRGDFPVPRVLGHGEVGGTEYLCLTRIPGAALSRTNLDPGDRHRALVRLGSTLRAIHDIDQAVLAQSDLLPGDRDPIDLRARVAGAFGRLAAAFDSDARLAAVVDIRRIAAERIEATPDDAAPVSLHSNPGPEHTFVDPCSGAFTGLIDFGDAYRSHPAFDFRPWVGGDAAAVLEGYWTGEHPPADFEKVRHTVLLIDALGRAARGRLTAEGLAATLDQLTR
ncbi:MAG TPA: aminoglycoside phosphotransferase family protein [Acidimicrobiales bacterium]|nr:aminoglycoside phosphotransferase family protein [Acidimicrobiales bacterium]